MLVHKNTIKALALATSADSSRVAMTGIHVQEDGTLEATNGHWLARAKPCATKDDDFPASPIKSNGFAGVLPVEPLLAAANVAGKRCKVYFVLEHVQVGKDEKDQLTVAATPDLDSWQATQIREVEGQFPNTDSVWKGARKTKGVRIGFQASYLADIAKIAALIGGKDARIAWTFHGAENAAEWTIVGHEEIDGLLMPARFSED